MSKQFAKVGLALFGALGIGIPVLVAACYDPPEKNTQTPQDGNGDQDVEAGKCISTAGGFPSPNCDDSDKVCDQTACSIPASCGSTSTCMPLSDNTGKSTIDLRIRKLNVVAPPALADNTIRATVLSPNIELPFGECAEHGTGSFNWLLRVTKTGDDASTGTLETGGAPPSTDPRGKGYCFYNHLADNIQVNPAKTDITFDGDTFKSGSIPKLNVPIFLRGDVKNVIILPLSDVVIQNVTLSDNNNCVGRFDTKALDGTCAEDPSVCTKWKTGAALGGYITLEEADKVNVVDLQRSLCVVLTRASDGGGTTGFAHCPRKDGKLDLTDAQKGDYCSDPKGPGGCRDSFWLTATFAASAVNINDGSDTPECKAP